MTSLSSMPSEPGDSDHTDSDSFSSDEVPSGCQECQEALDEEEDLFRDGNQTPTQRAETIRILCMRDVEAMDYKDVDDYFNAIADIIHTSR